MEIEIIIFWTALFSQVTSEKSMWSLKDTFPWKSQKHFYEKCESLLEIKKRYYQAVMKLLSNPLSQKDLFMTEWNKSENIKSTNLPYLLLINDHTLLINWYKCGSGYMESYLLIKHSDILFYEWANPETNGRAIFLVQLQMRKIVFCLQLFWFFVWQ